MVKVGPALNTLGAHWRETNLKEKGRYSKKKKKKKSENLGGKESLAPKRAREIAPAGAVRPKSRQN